MKIKKLLSIMMTMNNDKLDSMTHEEATRYFMEFVNARYKKLMDYEAKLKERGIDLEERKRALEHGSLLSEMQKVSVIVTDEEGIPLCARVKVYPILEGENPQNFNRVNGRIDRILRNTDEKGQLTMEVPTHECIGYSRGKLQIAKIIAWVIEVSKGSEYEPIESLCSLSDEEKGLPVHRFRLKKILNLRALGWVAGDIHHHSVYSSPLYGGTDDVIESAKEVRDSMVSSGLSFGALSDHHNILNHEDWSRTETEEFLPIVSKEISTSNGHVMAMNVSDDVIYQIPKDEDRQFDVLLSEFIRITEEIKDKGGLAQINHPRDMNPSISLSSQMTEYTELFDTMEIWNGSIPFMPGTTNDQAFQLWLNCFRNDEFIPATSGSDTHNTRADDYHELYNELSWLAYHMERDEENLKDPELKEFLYQFKETAEIFEKWAEENLGSGGVRTFVHCTDPSNLKVEEILNSLKMGKSFLTNGPILLPTLLGKTIGDHVVIEDDNELSVHIQLYSHQPLEELRIYGKNGRIKTIGLQKALRAIKGHYEWEFDFSIDRTLLQKNDGIVLRALSDYTNQVITNPIFIERK